MTFSLNKQTLQVLLVWAKTCLPWTYFYLPIRGLFSLIKIDPERTIWRIGESFQLRSCTKLPDGNMLFYRPFTWDHEAIKDVYGYEEYEKVFHIREGDVVVDVGAHIGTFSLKAGRKVKSNGVVLAVEPEKDNYSLLTANKKINNLENIITIYGALSDHTGEASLYSREGHSGGFSIVEKHSSHYIRVPVFTLDNLASKFQLNRIDYLKIDAEGSELAALQGGKRILKDSDAKIVVAAYHKSNNPKKITIFLQSLGYRSRCSEDKFIYAWRELPIV
jgi:FkbM family methyltransferase